MNILHKQLITTEAGAASPNTPPHEGEGSNSLRQRWLKLATGDVDRAGDIIRLNGMHAENFLRNPQFLWQHGRTASTISTIGRIVKLVQSQNALYALAEYASAELSPLAEQVYQMDLAGLVPANSIGFRPIEYEPNEYGGITFKEWELVECSKVELPMNPQAVDSRVENGEWRVENAKSERMVNGECRVVNEESITVQAAVDWLFK